MSLLLNLNSVGIPNQGRCDYFSVAEAELN